MVSCVVAPPAFPMSRWLWCSMRGRSSVQPTIFTLPVAVACSTAGRSLVRRPMVTVRSTPRAASRCTRSASRRGVNHVEDAALGIGAGRWPFICEIGKFGADGEAENFDLVHRHASALQHRRALFVWREKIIGVASVPGGIDGNGIGDDYDAFAARQSLRVALENFAQHVGIGWEGGNYHVRSEPLEQRDEMRFQPGETAELFIKVFFAVDPAVNLAPHAWRVIDDGEITSTHQVIDRPVGFRKQVAQFDFGFARRDARKPVADAARGAVMTLSETGSEDQDFLLHG